MDERSRIEELERENESLRRQLAATTGHRDSTERLLSRLLGDRVVLQNLPDFVSVLDRETRVLYLNKTIPGRTVEEMIGTVSTAHLTEDHRRRFVESFEAAWTSGERRELEFATQSGYEWVSRFVPVRDGGEVVLMLVTTTDVTRHRQAERAHREAATYLEQVIEASGMGIWSWYLDADSVAWDDRLRGIFGVGRDDSPLTYERYLGFIAEADRARVAASIASALETGVYEDLEHRIVRPDGSERHVLCKGFVLRRDDGTTAGLRGGVFDVTERHRLEQELRQLHTMEAIGRLTAGLAHNFNNLLGIILPNVELARLGPSSAVAARLEAIEHAAQRASEMVRDLMLVARGGGHALRRPEDLRSIVGRTIAIARSTFGPAISIELQARDATPAVMVNAGQIEQVLLNVCLNARDAIESAPNPDPKIVLRIANASATHVTVQIVDNGPGMDETTLSQAFEPFFTTKEVNRGTGLGLASAYAIVMEHGGRIECESALGIGTTFTIALPIANAPVSKTATTPVAPPARGSERILLVDDEAGFRDVVRTILESSGFAVVEACDGVDALARLDLAEASFDLAIIDGAMPRLGGEGLLSELEKRGTKLPVIFLSGHQVDGAVGRADAVLGKPISARALLESVRSVIDRARARGLG